MVADDGTVVTSRLRSTPATDVAAIRGVIVDLVAELRREHEVGAVGIGAAGWIDASRSTVQFAPNLAWRDEPLRELLSAHIDLPIVVENDANVATWAEFRYGAAAEADSAALFTVGTGIGGGIVIDGNLVRGAHGIAAEFGHTLAVPGGRECGCGRHGCLEQYASGNALVRFAKRAATEDPDRATALLKAADNDVDAIDGPMVTEAARGGDPVSIAAFEDIGEYLGEALADIAQLLDPDVIVIGGGVINAGDLLLEPARRRYREALAARSRIDAAVVVPARMGPMAGIVGAADLARR
ncbi:ROK family glucokinase [Stackebrandtia albiflava]